MHHRFGLREGLRAGGKRKRKGEGNNDVIIRASELEIQFVRSR
jgi:hypothetical protein